MYSNSINLVPRTTIIDYYNTLIANKNILGIAMAVIDLILVATLILIIYRQLKKTRVFGLVRGLVLLLAINFLSDFLKLPILRGILSSITTYFVLMLLIIFQPELRKILEKLGSTKIFKYFTIEPEKDIQKIKDDIYKITIAASELGKEKTGALIVIEKDIKLTEIIGTGININADISVQLLRNIFIHNTPLHDGAVIISDGKIKSACSILPLADDNINKAFGTRHRAALGMSKASDAIVVVVSEETGKLSIAMDGKLLVGLSEDKLKSILLNNLIKEEDQKRQNKKLSDKISKLKNKLNKTNNNI